MGKLLFAKLIEPEPAVAVTVPPQLLTTLGVLATTRLPGTVPTFDGKLSVKLPLMVTTLPFVIEKVIVVAVFVGIVFGAKLLVICGGSRMIMPTFAVPPLEAPSPAVPAV